LESPPLVFADAIHSLDSDNLKAIAFCAVIKRFSREDCH
jgi:hypothetical protein